MYDDAYSAAENTATAMQIITGFFLPRNTAARAVQPRPEAMPGTNDESRTASVHPQRAPQNEAMIHESDLYDAEEIPRESSTAGSVPVMRSARPVRV